VRRLPGNLDAGEAGVTWPRLHRPHGWSARPIPSLDGLRALAVLIVVVSHAGWRRHPRRPRRHDLFFFLSGYLITTLILDEQERDGGHPHFYLRRLRLLPRWPSRCSSPTRWSASAAGRRLQLAGSDLAAVLPRTTSTSSYDDSQPGGRHRILWSLAVEEHFYLLFPIVMYVVFRFRNARVLLLRTFAVLCILALAWRCWLVAQPGFVDLGRTTPPTPDSTRSSSAACCLWRTRPACRSPLQPGHEPRDWLLCAAASPSCWADLLPQPQFRESFRYTLQACAHPIFFFAIRNPTTGPFRLLNTRMLARIGILSYGISRTSCSRPWRRACTSHPASHPVRVRIGVSIAFVVPRPVHRSVLPATPGRATLT
jgi:peptidoglycan/LPS O-acetylase OafA/YrhL